MNIIPELIIPKRFAPPFWIEIGKMEDKVIITATAKGLKSSELSIF